MIGYGINKSMNNSNTELNHLAMQNIEALAQSESSFGKGTLYGNASGTRYCCCPGSNSCEATDCSFNCT